MMPKQEARLVVGLLTALGFAAVLAVRGPSVAAAPQTAASNATASTASNTHAHEHAIAGLPQADARDASCKPWGGATGDVRVRKNATQLRGFDLSALRKGVEVMRSRAESDPTSWLYQANIHGTTDNQTLPAWKTCQHGNYFFLSWHRMYIYFFERILRKASGFDPLTLFYWNYSNPAQRALPVDFRQPANAGNPLFLAERAPGINQGDPVPASATDFSVAFSFINFTAPPGSGQSFGGQRVPQPVHFDSPSGRLESLPHNAIHNVVGGPNGFMSDPDLAAQDPIFWSHHANIDRLWSHWIAEGGGRANPPASDTVWNNTAFKFFDENGQCVTLTGAQIVDTVQQLRYRYDDEGTKGAPSYPSTRTTRRTTEGVAASASGPMGADAPNGQENMAEIAGASSVQLTGQRQTVPVEIKEEQKAALRARATSTAASTEHLTLVLDSIDYDQGAYYEVYLNLPEGTKPNSSGPYFIGVVAPFAMKPHGDMAAGNVKMDFDLTHVVNTLSARKLWKGDAMHLTFVPAAAGKPAAAATVTSPKLKIGRVQVLSSK